MIRNRIRAAIASLFIAIAAIGFIGAFFPSVMQRVAASPFISKSISDEAEVATQQQWVTAGPLTYRISQLTIKYPLTMLEDETTTVEAAYSVRHWTQHAPRSRTLFDDSDPPGNTEFRALDRRVEMSLKSSGFTIAPADTFTKHKGQSLPIKELWTITPVGTGERVLHLKLNDSATPEQSFGESHFPTTQNISINGQAVPPDSNGFYELRVAVQNYWGVSQRTATVVSAVIAVIAFFLGLPVVAELMKARALKSNAAERT